MTVIPLAIFLDYQVLDHMHRLEVGTYVGQNAPALHRIRKEAERGTYQVWMAEITRVEMIIGRENPSLDPVRLATIESKDERKLAIARDMNVCWLGYPCSKLGDTYSRIGVSFRLAGPESQCADVLEKRLLNVQGISAGDARQVVSCIYGCDAADTSSRPTVQWFVSEDQALRDALVKEIIEGRLNELVNIRIGSVKELAAT